MSWTDMQELTSKVIIFFHIEFLSTNLFHLVIWTPAQKLKSSRTLTNTGPVFKHDTKSWRNKLVKEILLLSNKLALPKAWFPFHDADNWIWWGWLTQWVRRDFKNRQRWTAERCYPFYKLSSWKILIDRCCAIVGLLPTSHSRATPNHHCHPLSEI